MNKKSYVTHALFLGVVVVALFQVVMFRKMQNLEQRLEREARSERRHEVIPSTPVAVVESTGTLSNPAPAPVAIPTAPTPTPAPVSQATASPKPTADLEKLVRKIVKEERAKSPQTTWIKSSWKDPMTVMKEELKLSPSQETRILELRKARTEWYRELGRQYKLNPNRNTEEYGRAKLAYQETYRDSLMRELDQQQQARLEELIESGQIRDMGGQKASITVTSGSAVIERREK